MKQGLGADMRLSTKKSPNSLFDVIRRAFEAVFSELEGVVACRYLKS
jgi:hypothetical protein